MKNLIAFIASCSAVVTASAAEPSRPQQQLVSTLGCVMLAQKYVAAAAVIQAQVPRKDAVIALATTKLPNQTPQEALRDAEQILDFVSRQPASNADRISDEKFASCVKEKLLPMNGARTPRCWRLLPALNEVMAGRKQNVSKGQALKSLKEAKGIEGLQDLDWKGLVDRAYKWERGTSEFSVGEVLDCGQ